MLVPVQQWEYDKGLFQTLGGFHFTSSPLCWWTKTKDLALAPLVRPPAIVYYTIVICASRI